MSQTLGLDPSLVRRERPLARPRVFLLALAFLCFVANFAHGQSRELAGFQYMHLVPPQYSDGSVDRNSLVPYAQKRLASQGWTFLSREQVERLDDLDQISQTLICGLSHTANDTLSNSVTLRCEDLLGMEMINLQRSGTGFTIKGDLEAAIRQIVEQLAKLRPGFVESAAVDLLSTIPGLERDGRTEADLDRQIVGQQLTHLLEGFWSGPSEQPPYRLGIFKAERPGEFVAVVFESPTALWQPGMVKARLSEAADGRSLLVRYRLGNHEELNGVADLQGAALRLSLRDRDSKNVVLDLVKLRPSVDTSASLTNPPDRANAGPAGGSTPLRGSGTGFVVHPSGLLLTAYHVIEKAAAVHVSCGGRPAQPAAVKSSSAATDLAVLEAPSAISVETFLRLSQTRLPALGTKVFTIGYPLVDLLGADPKYTDGTISALTGPGGDASYLQISVPVQPGNSGGPLVNEQGEVIGVVIATASAPAFFQASGTIPQNINWAVKGVYASALFEPPADSKQNDVRSGSIVERVREATCLVLTTQ